MDSLPCGRMDIFRGYEQRGIFPGVEEFKLVFLTLEGLDEDAGDAPLGGRRRNFGEFVLFGMKRGKWTYLDFPSKRVLRRIVGKT